jgi:hypothetical protein
MGELAPSGVTHVGPFWVQERVIRPRRTGVDGAREGKRGVLFTPGIGVCREASGVRPGQGRGGYSQDQWLTSCSHISSSAGYSL